MFDETYSAKVTDFCFGLPTIKQIGSTSTVTTFGSDSLVRSHGYIAPEFKDGIVGVATDVYSYGIVSRLVPIMLKNLAIPLFSINSCMIILKKLPTFLNCY